MTFMKKIRRILFQILTLSFLLSGVLPTTADAAISDSYGYQLALMDARASNPQNVLLNKKITPSNASVREFEWVLETLRNRCRNSPDTVVKTMVEMWRVTQRRGYSVTLLEFGRQSSDLANIAFQAMRNQKMDYDKVCLKLIKDKYPNKQ